MIAYDLPDLAACLAPGKLMMAGITNSLGRTIETEIMNEGIDLIKTDYRLRNADGQLRIIFPETKEKPDDFLMEWIR